MASRRALSAEDLLEQQANQLLWSDCRPPDLEYPFYAQSWLTIRALRQEVQLPPAQTSTEPPASVLLDELLAAQGLPRQQRLVLELVRAGANESEIARLTGIPRQTVRRQRARAIEQLRRWVRQAAEDAEAARGEQIRQVLAEERRLLGPDEEKHCLPGREACRSTGLCKFRWYLYYDN